MSTTNDNKLEDIQNTISRITASTIAPDPVDGTDNQTNSIQKSTPEVSSVDLPADVSSTTIFLLSLLLQNKRTETINLSFVRVGQIQKILHWLPMPIYKEVKNSLQEITFFLQIQ